MSPYFGGKSYTTRWIISNFPENYKDLTYCEVFGGGWILFKKEPSNFVIYNDLNRDLVNLFLTIRDHHKEFSHRAEWSLHSRVRFERINARLKKVQIECLDFEIIIEKYDTKNILFYLDPPYIGGERYYKTKEVDFMQEDHIRLARVLKGIKGRFILSYYDHESVRSNYKAFNMVTKEVPKYCVGNHKDNSNKQKPFGRELLIMSY